MNKPTTIDYYGADVGIALPGLGGAYLAVHLASGTHCAVPSLKDAKTWVVQMCNQQNVLEQNE